MQLKIDGFFAEKVIPANKFKSNMALRQNMKYDEKSDEYTCQNGKKLRETYIGKRNRP